MKYIIRKFALFLTIISVVFSFSNISYGLEILAGFEKDKDLPVLNEELRKIDDDVKTNTDKKSSVIVQIVNTQTGAYTSNANSQIPMDDSIPQNTEGDEVMTLAITPTVSTNKLKIDVVVWAVASQNSSMIAALFQDSTAGALAAMAQANNPAGTISCIAFTHYMAAGTTSSTTFKVRVGSSGNYSMYFNGTSASRMLGGVIASSITISEVVP